MAKTNVLRFIVTITFNDDRKEVIKDVDTLTYSTSFVDNKWVTYLDISKDIHQNPKYYSFEHFDIKRIEIVNDG